MVDQPNIAALWDPINVDPYTSNAVKESAQIKKHQADAEKKAAQDFAKNPDVDKDCDWLGPLKFACVGVKSITKGGQGAGNWLGGIGKGLQNPLVLAGAAIAVILVLVLVLKVRL